MKKYLAVLTLVLAFVAQSVVAADNEVLYLADTAADTDGISAIYKIEIQDGAANLVLIPNGILPYNHADVIAAEPDGSRIWFLDDFYGGTTDSGMLGWYEVADASVHEVGVVTYNGERMVQIDQAAISPDGTLYIAHNLSDSLYVVNKDTAVATLVGPIVTPEGVLVDVQGADIAIGADGEMYLWVNWPMSGAPQGLYVLDLPAGGIGNVIATWIGGEQEAARRFTGLALRANGLGDLVGSTTAGTYSNSVVVVDKTTGLFVDIHPMMRDGVAFDHTWGDMSIGPFPQEEPPEPPEPPTFCTYTIGYWKTHSWEGRTITILGVVVDETLGKKILWGARGNNMSMLFAQLVAAKLNVNNTTGIEVIDGAEDFLVTMDEATGNIVIPDGQGGWTLNWNRAFDSCNVRTISGYWAEGLDEFNNMYHCEEEEEEEKDPPSCDKGDKGGKGGKPAGKGDCGGKGWGQGGGKGGCGDKGWGQGGDCGDKGGGKGGCGDKGGKGSSGGSCGGKGR